MYREEAKENITIHHILEVAIHILTMEMMMMMKMMMTMKRKVQMMKREKVTMKKKKKKKKMGRIKAMVNQVRHLEWRH